MQHGQGICQARVVDHRAQVFGGVFRIDEGRQACDATRLFGGRELPRHVLAHPKKSPESPPRVWLRKVRISYPACGPRNFAV